MKKITALFIFLACLYQHVAFAQAPSGSQNYIIETTVKAAGHKTVGSLSGLPVDSANRLIRYLDGLGRPLQTVQWQASPGKKDIVQVNEYDAFGREVKKYLPYVEQSGSDGSYKPTGISSQGSYYSPGSWDANVVKTGSPFAITNFEASPLNRVIEQGAPGAPWQPVPGSTSGHTIKMVYGSNVASDVLLWQINGSGAVASGYYPAGRLFRTVSMDENWVSGNAGNTEEFKDFEGRVVLRRVYKSDSEKLNTYYIYDDLGNLRYVVPPAVTLNSFTESDPVFGYFIYGYHYDGRKRLIEKKLPGKGWEEVIYNPLDQVVFTQDAVQRGGAIRSFIKYDALGRTVMTGIEIGHHGTRAEVQGTVNTLVPYWETRDNTAANYHGYNNLSCPSFVPNLQPHVVNYYDDYNIPGIPDNQSSSYSNKTRGLLTASKTLVLGTADTFLWTVNYYDEDGRLARSWQQHYKGGVVSASSYDQNSFTYNFSGELTSSVRAHVAGGAVTTIVSGFGYDHVGRKRTTNMQINNGSTIGQNVQLNEYLYNEIGQLTTKKLHNGVQSTRIAYNERGWLKSSISNEFSIQLDYQESGGNQWNGNISRQYWSQNNSPSASPNVFSYGYDKLDRLINGTSTGIYMSEVLNYDNMGNINQLSRNGGAMNQYYYNGNRLDRVDNVAGTYAYDANGNATTDGRTGMNLSYNLLNLPSGASGNGKVLSYVYDADGSKLRKVVTENGLTTSREYIDGIEYDGNNIDIIHTEEGVAQRNGDNSYSYHYNLSDQLGNVRYTFDVYNGLIRPLQVDNYYPFGKRNSLTSGNNKYLYNGKEAQDELGGQLDYGARFYDPEIGRWNSVDPKAELGRRWSTYNYAFNNPIMFVDPDGMFPGPILGGPVLNKNVRTAAFAYYKFMYNMAVNNVALVLNTISNANNAGMAKGKIKAEYTKAANEGVKEIVVSAAYGEGAGRIIGQGVKAAKGLKGAVKIGEGAAEYSGANAASGLKLSKQLASEQQVGEIGDIIAGGGTGKGLRKAEALSQEFSGRAEDWVKRSSSNWIASDGTSFETHWEENLSNGYRVNIKTKIEVKTPTAESLNPKDLKHK